MHDDERLDRLHAIVEELGSVVVALSGGVDSSLLAHACHAVLDDRALAVVARSPSLPRRELDTARRVAGHIGIACEVIDTTEVDDPRYAANPRNRCYFCKEELFSRLDHVAAERGFDWVAYGENLDDADDHRPGRAAAVRRGVRAPLREAELTKADVRDLARALDVPVWDKPAFACLASRFPHGTQITPEALRQVEEAEDALWRLGVRQVRVRYHGDLARIEVDPADLQLVVAHAGGVVAALRRAGFVHVTLDLAGYRRGGSDGGAGEALLPLVD